MSLGSQLEDRVRELEKQIQSPPQSPPTIPKKKGPKNAAAIGPVFHLPPPTIVAPAIVSINHDSLAPDFGQPLKKPPGAERPALLTVTKVVDAKTPSADAVGTHSTRIAIRKQLLGLGLSAVAPKPTPSSSSVVIAAPLRIKTPAQINVMKAIPEGEANKKNLGGSGYNDGKFDKGKGKEKANPEEEEEGNREENDWVITLVLLAIPSICSPALLGPDHIRDPTFSFTALNLASAYPAKSSILQQRRWERPPSSLGGEGLEREGGSVGSGSGAGAGGKGGGIEEEG